MVQWIKLRQKSSCIIRKRESGSLNKWNMHGEPSIIKEGMWPTSSKTAQMSYYKNIISKNKHDFKAIYKIINSLLFRKQEAKLPPITPPAKLAENFSEFFDGKIAKIMHHLHETIDDDPDRYMYKEENIPNRNET